MTKTEEVLEALGQPIYWYYFDWRVWHELFRFDSISCNSWRFDRDFKYWVSYENNSLGKVWNYDFFNDLYSND